MPLAAHTKVVGEMHEEALYRVRNAAAVFDAGGDSSRDLRAALYRCIDELLSGQVLQVIGRDPGSRGNILEWCALTGNRVLWSEKRAEESLFWIEKG